MNQIKIILAAVVLVVGVTGLGQAQESDPMYSYFKLLTLYSENGQVEYQALQNAPEVITQVLGQFESVSEADYDGWAGAKKKAFWINAYNFAMIKTVVQHYPLSKGASWKAVAYPANSVQQIPKIWDRPAIRLLGKDRSLNEIEHEILRKEFKDPRVHFALVCASTGCPVLRAEPYSEDKLDAQFADQVRIFLADKNKFSYDKKANVFYLSPIFKWFGEDFKSSGGVIAFIKQYWQAEDAASVSQPKIKWLTYDWSLNEKRAA